MGAPLTEMAVSFHIPSKGISESRGQILQLQKSVSELDTVFDVDEGLTHHFAPGCYGRELFMPAGSVVVGKIHKHAHLNVLMEGEVTVVTPFGRENFKAPRIWISDPGTKRAVYNHSDVRWVTFHPTEETDLEKIEDFVIAPDFGEYDLFIEKATQELLSQEDSL